MTPVHLETPRTPPGARAADPRIPSSASGRRRGRRAGVVHLTVLTLAVPALFATVAIPAYAFTPRDAGGDLAHPAGSPNAQGVVIEAAASVTSTRDAFTATSLEELAAAEAARQAAERERLAQERAAATTRNGHSGPRGSAAAPPYPDFSLDAVVQVARQYLGTPYLFGGADPSGFDCSGFIQYVYAQFGVALPHSVSGQAAAGTRISVADARPGDLVIFNDGSHNGFWMGDGMILDSPRPGKSISIRPLWTDAYYIVRVGV